MSFIEMTKFLLSKNDDSGLFFLCERISQKPIEYYFGRQRVRGGRNENPTFQQCIHNAAALCVQKSITLDPVQGNCRRKTLSYPRKELMILLYPRESDQTHIQTSCSCILLVLIVYPSIVML